MLGYSPQRQVPAPTSPPIRWKMEIHQVRSMDKANVDGKTQTYRYVVFHSYSINPRMGQPAGMVGGRCSYNIVNLAKVMLTMFLNSEAHGLLLMVLPQASTQQRFTPGLNDNSPSHPNNQIHSLDMVRRSTPPHRKKETYI